MPEAGGAFLFMELKLASWLLQTGYCVLLENRGFSSPGFEMHHEGSVEH